MKKLNILILILIALFVVAAAFFWKSAFSYIAAGLCENHIVDTVMSPNGESKIVIFSVNCGATTDWSVHASLLKSDESINDKTSGNILRINSNHGQAWPLAKGGMPIIKPVWESDNKAVLYYSNGSSIFFKKEDLQNVNFEFKTITKEFVEQQELEVRS